jgi:CRP-like cAMP-binding protein
MPPGLQEIHDKLVEYNDEAIKVAEDSREALMVQVRAIDEELRSLRSARRALNPSTAPARRTRQRSNSTMSDARRAAGSTAVEAARKVLVEVGRTTQAEIAKATGLNSGTVSNAMKVLEEDGLAQRTGRRHGNSPEWAAVASAAEAA